MTDGTPALVGCLVDRDVLSRGEIKGECRDKALIVIAPGIGVWVPRHLLVHHALFPEWTEKIVAAEPGSVFTLSPAQVAAAPGLGEISDGEAPERW